ncbi:MAG TPA: NfeD family protein [Blastocatellia bacterium]|nr:NfeD family protein [Blastocatellia bacterium]
MISGIEVFYLVCAGAGLFFALFAAISGHHGHGGGHSNAGGHGHGFHFGLRGRASFRGGARAAAPGASAHTGGGAHGQASAAHGNTSRSAEAHGDNTSVSFVSPLTAAVFVGSLGFLGLMGRGGLGLSPLVSLVFAAPLGLLVTAAVFYLFLKIFVASQGSSLTRVEAAVGLEAEVVAGIEGGRIGSISYVDKGKRLTLPARSDGEEVFIRGERVYIARIEGNTALVRRGRGGVWSD